MSDGWRDGVSLRVEGGISWRAHCRSISDRPFWENANLGSAFAAIRVGAQRPFRHWKTSVRLHHDAHSVFLGDGDWRFGGDEFAFGDDVDDVIGEAGFAAGA